LEALRQLGREPEPLRLLRRADVPQAGGRQRVPLGLRLVGEEAAGTESDDAGTERDRHVLVGLTLQRDGLRVLVQAYTAWQVPNDPQHIRQFLRAMRNQPDEAARQLRSFFSAAMHITASNFNLADLVNSNPANVHIDTFEQQLRSQVGAPMLQGYGIEVRQVGIERLTLPAATLTATVARMSAERETVAAQRTASGIREVISVASATVHLRR
jgi:regulator of protease activity HflC (stomatin/prohibitin superfamily)